MSGNQKIRTSRRARAALLLIGVVLVALVPMAPANAAASITISRGTVIGGESITVSGNIGMKKARQVVLQRQSGSSWVAVISSRSTTAGAYKFTYKPPTKSPSKTVIRVIAPRVKISGKTYPQITSGGRSVLTVGQGATISMPASTPRDQPFNVTGTFTPARNGRTVVLQKPASTSGWVSVGAATKQNSLGKVTVPMTLKVQGTYTFRLLTLAAGGAAAVASQPLTIEVKAPLSAPAVPTGLTAQPGDGKATLTWNAVTAPDLAGYAIYRRTSTLEQWNLVTTVAAGTTSTVVQPLTNGQSYLFSVTAFDNESPSKESDKSTTATVTPTAPVDTTPPAVPTGLAAEPGNSSVQLTWNAVAPDGLAGYHVYRATNAAGPWTKLTTNTTSSTSYNASGLTNGTEYFFAVTSVDNSPGANESAKSSVASATPAQAADTTPPAVPTGVDAEAGNASATVSWTAVAAADLNGYRVYRGTSASGPWTDPVTVDKNTTSTVVNGLTNGATYYFAVTSVDVSANESAKSTAASAVPQAGANVWSTVSAGTDHTCAIRSDNSLWCWGRNSYGQLGGAGSIVTAPARVGNLNTWNGVSAGDRFTCATKTDGTLWCWGRNKYGQTGSTANLDSEGGNAVPTQLGSATTWTKVSAGGNSACGLQGGTLWCWGLNLDGQLGKAANANTETPNPTPSQVGAATSWTSVSAGGDHACGTQGSALSCWGSNLSGQLGNATSSGTFTPTTTPAAVAGSWTSVSAGGGHTCAVNGSAQIWCWGANAWGELGKGANAGANPTPAKITDRGWASVSAGTAHTCAVTTTGTAWCWGHNQAGQLGKTANTNSNVEPSQVAGTTWSTIDAGGDHTAATTTSGTILTWGSNEFGQLGTTTNAGTTNPNPTPIQVPVP